MLAPADFVSAEAGSGNQNHETPNKDSGTLSQ
jgi:hypothetical protein